MNGDGAQLAVCQLASFSVVVGLPLATSKRRNGHTANAWFQIKVVSLIRCLAKLISNSTAVCLS